MGSPGENITSQADLPAALKSDAGGHVFNRLPADLDITAEDVVSHAPGLVYLYDLREGRSLFQNRHIAEVLGYSEEDAVEMGEKSWAALMHPEDQLRFPDHKLAMQQLKKGQAATFEYRLRHANGGWRTYVSRDVRLSGEAADGYIIGTGADITELKEAQEEIEKLNATLEERVIERTAQLESLCYSIAHDLRTHIRGISANAGLLRADMPQAERHVQDHLDRLSKAARKMGELVDDLLRYARASNQEMECEELDLSTVAREVAARVAKEFPDAKFVVAPGLNAFADPQMLTIVLENLFENACKYRSAASPVVEFGRTSEGALYVRDNGLGFEPQYAEKILRPFERLHRDEDLPGSGIGLANADRIVKRHGGKLWAESTPGAGATFFFTLG